MYFQQEHAYSSIQVLPAWRLDQEMKRRLILQETWYTRFFTAYFIDVDTFYLFLNWFSTCVSDDQKYLSGSRLYACINTRKFKGLDFREITSLPKINRMPITRIICIQWKFATPDHHNFANWDSYFFFDHLVVLNCSKVINAFKQYRIHGPTCFGKL